MYYKYLVFIHCYHEPDCYVIGCSKKLIYNFVKKTNMRDKNMLRYSGW